MVIDPWPQCRRDNRAWWRLGQMGEMAPPTARSPSTLRPMAAVGCYAGNSPHMTLIDTIPGVGLQLGIAAVVLGMRVAAVMSMTAPVESRRTDRGVSEGKDGPLAILLCHNFRRSRTHRGRHLLVQVLSLRIPILGINSTGPSVSCSTSTSLPCSNLALACLSL